MMSAVKLLLSLLVLCSCTLPVLPQAVPACEQFTIEPVEVGPGMPLIIREGGEQLLTCRHSIIGPHVTDWYREASAIRDNVPEGRDGCSCEVNRPADSDPVELMFTDFGPGSGGEYSCRVPDPFGSAGVFNVCTFDVLVAVPPTISPPVTTRRYERAREQNVFIPINATGRPLPTIEWRNGTQQLMNDNRVTIGSTGSLTVTNLMTYDRGNYSLTLSNIALTTLTNFSIFVQFVEIVSTSDPEIFPDSIVVECEAIGYPTVFVEWLDSLSSNNPLSSVKTRQSTGTFEKTFRSTLTVSRSECQDSYTCRAYNEERTTQITTSVNICNEVPGPPEPMNVMATQNGPNSVQVSWTIQNPEMIDNFEICYTVSSSQTCLPTRVESTVLSITVDNLALNQEYMFTVTSHQGNEITVSTSASVTLSPCTGTISNQIYGVSISTTVNGQGERTFNISWAEPSEEIVTGYRVMSDQGWNEIVRQKIITNVITPANFCNGDNHKFAVMAMNNCGYEGPASAKVTGNCNTVSRIRISSVKTYTAAIAVKWTLKSNDIGIQSPLRITVVELEPDNERQLRLNYSIADIADEAECLGSLKPSTVYKVCLHPVYSDGFQETVPVCVDVTTQQEDPPDANVDIDSCTEPDTTEYLGAVGGIALPDYAIALIVVGALIIIAVIFCLIGICFACSNTKSKDLEDMGSEYSNSIAGGMQGRMSSAHARSMSPTRSCLSYHSKGHSTNWNDHMGTLREMDTAMGTNV